MLHLGLFPVDVMKTQKQHTKHLNITENRETFEAHVKSPLHNDSAAQRTQISTDIEEYYSMKTEILLLERVQQQICNAQSDLNEKCNAYIREANKPKMEGECIIASSCFSTNATFHCTAKHLRTKKKGNKPKSCISRPIREDVLHSYTSFLPGFGFVDGLRSSIHILNVLFQLV